MTRDKKNQRGTFDQLATHNPLAVKTISLGGEYSSLNCREVIPLKKKYRQL